MTSEASKNAELFAQRPHIEPAALSRIEQLAKTNTAPQEIEKSQIQLLLEADTVYKDSLLVRHSELKAAMKEVQAEGIALLERTEMMKTVLHPIRNLPNETLHEILSPLIDDVILAPFLTDSPPTNTLIGSLNVKKHPLWVFSQVSRQWRDHILSQPRLWSYIHINLSKGALSSFASSFLLSLFITRSRKTPLHVSIYDSNTKLGASQSLSELLLQRHRWQHLTFTCSKRTDAFKALAYGPKELSLLESVRISILPYRRIYALDSDSDGSHNSLDLFPDAFTGFKDAPKLRRVRVERSWSDFCLYVELPLDQLTDVVVESHDIVRGHLAGFFELLPNATSLELRLTLILKLPIVPIESNILRSLTLEYNDGVRELIGALRLPALEEFTLAHNCDEGGEWDQYSSGMRIFGALDVTTGANLRNLQVTLAHTDGEPAYQGLRALLGSTPRLQRLTVGLLGSGSTDELCSVLNSELIPVMTSLVIFGRFGGLEVSPLLTMMIQRRRHGLADVVVRGVREPPAPVLEVFNMFVEDGMSGEIVAFSE